MFSIVQRWLFRFSGVQSVQQETRGKDGFIKSHKENRNLSLCSAKVCQTLQSID